MISLSRKERVLKHQQVPLRCWFFTGVMGFSFTTVNWKSLGEMGAAARDCAMAAENTPLASTAIAINFFIFLFFKAKTNVTRNS